MVYAIPVPMSYLVSEKRVKDTILKDGWIVGIKSVFFSSDLIRKIEVESRANEEKAEQCNGGSRLDTSKEASCLNTHELVPVASSSEAGCQLLAHQVGGRTRHIDQRKSEILNY